MNARFVYADPPYVGCAHHYDHVDAERWNDPQAHVDLIWQMHADHDGWALSCSAPSLRQLLPYAPTTTRVAAWVKPFAAYKRNVQVAYTWEAVLFDRTLPRRPDEPVGRDHLSASIALDQGLVGAKPEAFARWLIVLLGILPDDDLVDLFPGSGAIGAELGKLRLL